MLNLIALKLDREGEKGREYRERGGGIFEGGDYFKYFGQGEGGGAIIRRRRLIEVRLLFEEIQYPV